MLEYKKRVEQYAQEISSLGRRHVLIGNLRLGIGLLLLVVTYFVISRAVGLPGYLVMALLLGGFLYLVNVHQKSSARKKMSEALLKINEDELQFLDGKMGFDPGDNFVDHGHQYAHDLDVFGQNSLFQYLNRAQTFAGRAALARGLKNMLDKESILENQKAVQELAPQLDFRQEVQALSMLNPDKESIYKFIMQWSTNRKSLNRFSVILSYVFPILFFVLMIGLMIGIEGPLLNLLALVFICNLVLMGKHLKDVNLEINQSESVNQVIRQYGVVLNALENHEFKSARLVGLKLKVLEQHGPASVQLSNLGALLSKLESIQNGLVAMIFSGTVSYHLHVLQKLYTWKNSYAELLPMWLEVIAEFEMLSSLANLKYNNPEYGFPSIVEGGVIRFENMAHPMVAKDVSVANDLTFDEHRFIVLTGSNMSGKSTFLRSVGLNMVLAGMGAPVCATDATISPMRILVSMRIADSLAENESYFYAEVKRLKSIMDRLNGGGTLVLLDEVLRGTNSDDKRNGTLEIIRRMVRERVFGIIATHDLEVCKETALHPDALTNKCFEVEIKNGELHFDYKLRPGICVNQSATFLMKKLGVI